ncbi:hypothetical protein [Thermoflavimicrobium dichotomicum]|uniref:PQQ-like domain-containing protein n=1 Tax=Thermoflavimicrobium dichotomicum TaxID=46223 RepID=A0A1I3LFB8_9BACL|nr:hypothetical protein [Thermoflavimicrobium dichotomicum]SFI83494.1 hypothetical protein SAMN05421852_102168 [Thermoflavimicrobium dichotomicum]
MDWSRYGHLSEQWINESRNHVQAINDYRERGKKEGWDQVGNPPQTHIKQLKNLAPSVLEIVREANNKKETEALRKWFPPACEPVFDEYSGKGLGVEPLFIDENRFLVHINGFVHLVEQGKWRVLEDVLYVGRSPDRRYYALAYDNRCDLLDGWNGPKVREFYWPKNLEVVLEWTECSPYASIPFITSLIPFPDGKRILLNNRYGVFVIDEKGTKRIHPSVEWIHEEWKWHQEYKLNDPFVIDLSMEHAALSPDGKLIAVGDQCSHHRILDEHYQEVARIEPYSEYPHFALFGSDGRQIALNACHFYHGVTLVISLDNLPLGDFDLFTPDGQMKDGVGILDEDSRVYAGVAWEDAYIFGNAYGYLLCYNQRGENLWEHFIGGTISGMDISENGKQLIIGTYNGTLHLLELNTGENDPFTIGTSTHKELCRWLFWGEDLARPWVW